MRPDDLLRMIEEAIERNPDPGPHDMGITLVSPRSPASVLGVRCERLGYTHDGTVWNVPAKRLVKARDVLKAKIAEASA